MEVTYISVHNYSSYTAGYLGVTKIVDHSQEYPDHSETFFTVHFDDGAVMDIIDCPVIVKREAIP